MIATAGEVARMGRPASAQVASSARARAALAAGVHWYRARTQPQRKMFSSAWLTECMALSHDRAPRMIVEGDPTADPPGCTTYRAVLEDSIQMDGTRTASHRRVDRRSTLGTRNH